MPFGKENNNQTKYVPKPYVLKRTPQKVGHNGQEYLVDKIVEQMGQGAKLPAAIKVLYPTVPAASVAPIATKIRKHPYFIAYKDASLELLHKKSSALQQNMLDLAFNSRSDMVKYNATKDSLDRIHGEAGKEADSGKPTMIFNFSFNSTPPKQVTVDPDRQIIEGETV